jgi:uncharacterized RDD family membrane protein YckC
MAEQLTGPEARALRYALARASEQGWGIAIGTVAGLALWLATVVLVMRGGPNPGPHLNLLGIYFPGYRVTWVGAFIGFVYAFVVGYATGRTIATIYNRLLPRESETASRDD